MAGRARCIAVVLLLLPAVISAQGNARRLTTIDALKQFPSYYHLQSVLLRGELIDDSQRAVLRSDELELRLFLDNVSPKAGPVEVRGLVLDVGRMDPTDPRLGGYGSARPPEDWPKPGEEIVLKVTTIGEASTATAPSIRALALEPWKFDGQTVTLTGNFRGRNLFGDTPASPSNGRYDFVLRGAEGALWVTGVRPRGKGFDFDVDRRIDTDKWLEVTGVVSRKRGLVSLAATKVALAPPPETRIVEDIAPPPPPPPLQVVFSSPTEGETEVAPGVPVRIQFSRGLRESTIAGRIRVSYFGNATVPLDPKVTYDAATRSLQLRFATPLEPLRTVKVEVLEGLVAFDGGPLAPWSVTFSVAER
jgi:hypothetical protein